MIRRLFFPASPGFRTSLGLLALRVVVGAAFMFHGWDKIRNPFAWMGPDSGYPGILQALAAVSEFGGGAAWVLGALTPLASFGLACTMAVAALHHFRAGQPFVGKGGSYELATVYLSVAVLLLLAGPGMFSMDSLFLKKGDKK